MPKCICSGLAPEYRAISGSHHNPACPLWRVPTGGRVQILERLIAERAEAETKALDALGRYKFQMFGYWAGVWVHLNRIIGDRQPSPFKHLVEAAKRGESNADA